MKQLSFYEFTQLPKEEQYELALREGEFIGTTEKNDVKFALYKFYTFYVEVAYDGIKNKVVSLTCFLQSP
jgi:hypothetical protein